MRIAHGGNFAPSELPFIERACAAVDHIFGMLETSAVKAVA